MKQKTMKARYDIPPGVNPVVAFGVHDSNVRLIERLTGVKIFPHEFEVVIEGDDNAVLRASQILQNVWLLAKGNTPISHDEIRVLVDNRSQHGEFSTETAASEGIIVSRRGMRVKTRSALQARYVREMLDKDLVMSVGPAGTGKTYLAIAVALHSLLTKRVERIVLSRPVVEAGENLGFLPGTLEEKINPYLKPLFDAISQMLSPEELTFMLDRQIIELAPLAYMRGRTLSNAFIILDEAQNTTSTQMKMFLTRLGEGSKMVVTGDVTQIDLPYGRESGLKQAIDLFEGMEEVAFLRFEEKDVVRHGLVRKILEIYRKREEESWKKITDR
jgi:phosphate starvation-inducible PhoH-like protein